MSIQEIEAAIRQLRSEQLRELLIWLQGHVSKVEGDGKNQDSDTPFVSAYEAGKRWVGSIEGPEDMSTNPRYLDDLGRSSLK